MQQTHTCSKILLLSWFRSAGSHEVNKSKNYKSDAFKKIFKGSGCCNRALPKSFIILLLCIENHSVILAFGYVSQPFLVCLCSAFHSASENSDCVTFPSRPPFLLYANSWWYRLRIERNSILSWRSMRSFPPYIILHF